MDSSPSTRASQLPLEPEQQRDQQTRKPSLLPAFEPLSSSPFPRPTSSKRKFDDGSPTLPKQQLKYYPTPVPTSSTGILGSSSPQKRPGLERTISVLSERQPLGAMPTVELPENGNILRMGRSSNSADYQLSTNRLISRVHVQAAYCAPTASYPRGCIEVECLGWNGATIHCGGNVFDLKKNETYTLENPEQEIILDVQDTRVMIAWPYKTAPSWDSDDDLPPPRRPSQGHFASSPPLIPRSPVSQSPIRQPVFDAAPTLPPAGPLQVFEDEDALEENGSATPTPTSPIPADETFIRSAQSHSKSDRDAEAPRPNFAGSRNESFPDEDEENEENDPIVLSFGPFGANLNSCMASFSTATPLQPLSAHRRRSVLKSSSPRKSSSFESPRFKESPIKNHIINQLAYSRIHSQPLSAIHSNLPAELKKAQSKELQDDKEGSGASTPVPQFSKQDLKTLMDSIPCIGEIPRSGKDAAGQPLENEFYYVPEMDTDMLRRETVGVRGTGLRSVRKQHKQYYWKKPRV